jgi:hypothetical protein
MPDIRSTLQGIIENPRSTEKERNTARRRLAALAAAEEEKSKPKPAVSSLRTPAPAPAPAAPRSVDVTPPRSWKPTEDTESTEELLKRLTKPRDAEDAEYDRSPFSLVDVVVVTQLKPEPVKTGAESEEGREVLRKSGRQLIANFESAQARAFQSLVMTLGNGSAIVRPAREYELAVRAAARQLVQWWRTSGDVPQEPEFRAGHKKLIDYLRKERDDQLAAEKTERVMDFVMTAAPARQEPKKKTSGFGDGLDDFQPY